MRLEDECCEDFAVSCTRGWDSWPFSQLASHEWRLAHLFRSEDCEHITVCKGKRKHTDVGVRETLPCLGLIRDAVTGGPHRGWRMYLEA